VDSIMVSLSKFCTVLHPGSPKSVVAFGESEKARLAVETMFTIANRCSGSLVASYSGFLLLVWRWGGAGDHVEPCHQVMHEL
jgi:hypothetical protein